MPRASTFTTYINTEEAPGAYSAIDKFAAKVTEKYATITRAADAAARAAAGISGGLGSAGRGTGGDAAARQYRTLADAQRAVAKAAARSNEALSTNRAALREQGAAASSASQQNSRLAQSMRGAENANDRLAQSLRTTSTLLGVVQGPLGPIAGRLSALSAAVQQFSGLQQGVAGLLGIAFAVGRLGNEYTVLQSKLRPFFETQQQANAAFQEVIGIAQRARAPLESIADLYGRLSSIGNEVGISQDRIARIDDAQTGLWQGWTEATGGAHFQRCLVFDFVDSYEVDNWFAVTPGERLFGSAYLNTGATNYTCAFGLMLQRADGSIHGWLQFGSRLAGQANWARVAGAIEIPQGVTLARPWLLHDNRALAPGNWARAGDMQITRAELGATVGAITGNNLISGYGRGVMTDDGIFTPIGYSLGFVGEGAGARANSLAQLDPTAASQLAAVAGGGIQVAALYGTIRKVMAPDASLNFDAAAGIEAGGNSGNVRVVIQVSPAGAESWSDIAVGFEQFVSASEPAFVTAAGGFTNSTGVQQVYEFRAIERRTPGSAGGAVVAAQSFLRG